MNCTHLPVVLIRLLFWNWQIPQNQCELSLFYCIILEL
jgi:hypothetical protein